MTIAIPTIPGREKLLARAKQSVERQTHPVTDIVVVRDDARKGAYDARNRAMMQVATEWTGFLDDDDVLKPHHVQTLLDLAEEHDADMVWGWFQVMGGTDPFPQFRGRQVDMSVYPEKSWCIPITFMVKTKFLHSAYEHMGGYQFDHEGRGRWEIQDKPLILDMLVRQGAKPMATDTLTWDWYHHGNNTSGLGTKR